MAAITFEEVLKSSTPTEEPPVKEQQDGDSFSIFKTDDDKRLVFGWASISITVDGEQLEDRQKDMIDPEDLEESVYDYVLNFRDTGEEHIPTMRKKGKLVESCVLTAEKQKAMGIPEGILPIGWWIGFKIEDDDAWARVKNGTYRMFSIEGKANRIPVEKGQPIGCGVLVVQDGKILAGTRIERSHRGQICGPGGHIEDGEAPAQAAKREAREEFGISCKELTPLGTLKNGRSAIFLCSKFTGTPSADDEEMTDAEWYTIDELREMDLYPAFEESLDMLGEVEKSTPNYEEFPSYDMWLEENLDATIEEQRAAKKHYRENKAVAKTFSDILKFNPYHDSRGRFASANSYSSFTIRTKDPKKQHMADMAISREKERAAAATAANPTNDPDTIAGTKRGKPMTHEQADEGRGNPRYEESREYRINCQSCVVAYEARLRGYDVEAIGRTNKNQVQETLARNAASAWIDPATGKAPEQLINDPKIRTQKQVQKWLEQNMEEGGRYELSHGWKGTNGRNGHIVTVTKDSSGALRIFDPQNGKNYTGSDVTEYLGKVRATYSTQKYNPSKRSGWESVPQGRLRLLRVDNLQINPDVANAVLKGVE